MANPSLPVRTGLDTIDPTRALENMRLFSAQDPYHYVLWLVTTAAGVSSAPASSLTASH